MGRVFVRRAPRVEYYFENGRWRKLLVTNQVIEQYRCNGELIQLPSKYYTILDHGIFGPRWTRCAKYSLEWKRQDVLKDSTPSRQITILPKYNTKMLITQDWICPDSKTRRKTELITLTPKALGIRAPIPPHSTINFNFMSQMNGCVLDYVYIEQQNPRGAKP